MKRFTAAAVTTRVRAARFPRALCTTSRSVKVIG
jgi:hypothetical protein